MNVIRITGMIKSYDKKNRAVDALSFDVEKGTIVGFVGRNGAGKTTTINAMAGILRPDAGDVELLGEPVRPGDWRYKSRVGFLLERANYVENLTGREYLRFACVMQKIAKKDSDVRIDELIDFLELREDSGKPIRDYSKGMKKKTALAAALIHNPELLILDEPLEGVDPVSANRIKKFLVSTAEKGKTIFISSHELGTIEKICGDMIIIDKGRLLFHGTTEGLREKIGSRDDGQEETDLETLFVRLIGEESKPDKLSWM